MTTDRPVLTATGKAELTRRLEDLRALRARLRAQLGEAVAASHGDTADQADLQDLRLEQARVEQRIAELEHLLIEAVVPAAPAAGQGAQPGSTLVVRSEGEEERYTLVGSAEADPRQGRVSVASPVGQALLGRRPGERVAVETPGGPRQLEVVRVE